MGPEQPITNYLEEKVFNITDEAGFSKLALAIFRFQYQHNETYRAYCEALGRKPEEIEQVEQIPFLPIQFFKSRGIKTGLFTPELVFSSSGTTGAFTSKHFVKKAALYQQSFLNGFVQAYGAPSNYCILGLLPSYLERGGSSLVYMVDALMKESAHPQNGFYLYNHRELWMLLQQLEEATQPTILFGVSYALLNFAESYPLPLQHTTIIETGGMKGRKKELSKPELYAELQRAFSLNEIHSEYGMTELLSQAYAVNGLYKTPPWMKILLREETDPFSFSQRSGAINVIDLANLYSCSFIATDDLGKLHPDGRFEVLGRLDNSDIRGCSQLVL